MSQENTEAQFFALAVLATLPPEWGPSTIAKIVCRLEPRKFDRTDLKSLCLTAPSVALLASIHSRSCKLSLGLIWLKPEKELGQWPLAARQSVSRTPAELRNINQQGELAKHYLVLAFDLFWVRLLALVLGLNTRARSHQNPLSIEFCRQKYGVGCHSLLQGIFLTKGSNPGLVYCWQILF